MEIDRNNLNQLPYRGKLSDFLMKYSNAEVMPEDTRNFRVVADQTIQMPDLLGGINHGARLPSGVSLNIVNSGTESTVELPSGIKFCSKSERMNVSQSDPSRRISRREDLIPDESTYVMVDKVGGGVFIPKGTLLSIINFEQDRGVTFRVWGEGIEVALSWQESAQLDVERLEEINKEVSIIDSGEVQKDQELRRALSAFKIRLKLWNGEGELPDPIVVSITDDLRAQELIRSLSPEIRKVLKGCISHKLLLCLLNERATTPALLADFKPADFRRSFSDGVNVLVRAIDRLVT